VIAVSLSANDVSTFAAVAIGAVSGMVTAAIGMLVVYLRRAGS
jgi:hypothetical protein